MTKRDIVRLAIEHKQAGSIPYCINFANDAKKKYGEYLKEKYLKGDIADAVSDGILTVDEGISLSMGNFVFCANDKPWWNWYDVPKSYIEDFDVPSFLPKVRGTGSYEMFEKKIKFVKETTGCYVLVMIYGSHFEKANSCRGIENFLADLAGNKEYAKEILDTIIRKNIVMIENLLTYNEIDGILLGSDWGSQQSLLMSPSTWHELIAPGELKEYKIIKEAGKDLWIHSCGNIEQIIPDLIDMGVDVLNPIQPEVMNIRGLKEKYGDKLTFWGGISTQRTLPYGTSKEVKDEVKEVVSYMSRNGGYITSPAQEIQADVPIENIQALFDQAREYI